MKKIILMVGMLGLLLFAFGCAKDTAEGAETVSGSNAGAAISAEEQEIGASTEELADLDTLSQETDNDVNFEELEELTK